MICAPKEEWGGGVHVLVNSRTVEEAPGWARRYDRLVEPAAAMM